MRNAEIARLLRHTAEAIDAQGGNRYRARAYARAAQRIETFPHQLERWVREGRDLREVPGVGDAIAAKVKEAVETGSIRLLERSTVAPRRHRDRSSGPLLRPVALAASADLRAWLAALPGVTAVEVAGDLRRGLEAVGSLDLVARVADDADPADVLDAFVRAGIVAEPDVGRGVVAGELGNGLRITVRAATPAAFGRAWLEATGPPEHAKAVLALAKGSRPSRAGRRAAGAAPEAATRAAVPAPSAAAGRAAAVGAAQAAKGAGRHADRRPVQGSGPAEQVVPGPVVEDLGMEGAEAGSLAAERALYGRAGLAWVPAELRDDPDALALAARGPLPPLLTGADLRGDLHSHTDATDGRASLERMVQAAVDLGLEYLAVTDHTQRTTIAGGLRPEEMRRHLARIDAVARKRDDIVVLKGAEVDILKDGRLDLPPDVLAMLDITVCSLHHRERQPGPELTRRILAAMADPRADILGHPTGRLIGRRPSMELDLERILEAARDQGWAVELDGQADRLDLPHPWVRRAKELGVPVSVSSDAHSVREFGNLEGAVKQARRGWLGPGDVLNARPVGEVLAWAEAHR